MAKEYLDFKQCKRVKLIKSFDKLNLFTASMAKGIEQVIASLIISGSINPDNLEGDVLDFGMGTGPGAYVLNQYGGNVTGVDICETSIQTAIKEETLPPDKVVIKDGLAYLNGLKPASLDFIGAFSIHPKFPYGWLHHASKNTLKHGGQLLIAGDTTQLKDVLHKTVGKYGKIEELKTTQDNFNPCYVTFVYTKN